MDALDPAFMIQVKAARALLGWSQKDLAEKANISLPVISRIERGHSPGRVSTLRSLQTALTDAGVIFLTEPDGAFGVKVDAGVAATLREQLPES